MKEKNIGILNRGGWHFSYFGGIDFIKNKLNNFSHQEYNNEKYTNNEYIMERIKNNEDLFLRDFNKFIKTPIENNNYLPRNYKLLT